MSRQATDQLYIELDYYYPEEYYVYTAEAVASLSTAATLGCDAGKIRSASASMTAAATVSCDVGNIKTGSVSMTASTTVVVYASKNQELVLTAFTAGTLTASAQRQRVADIAATGAFTTIIDYIRQRDSGYDETAAFTQSVAYVRSRDLASAVQAAFSLTADGLKIIDADATLNISATQTSTAIKTAVATLSISSSASITADAIAVKPTSVSLSSAFTSKTRNTIFIRTTSVSESSGGYLSTPSIDTGIKKFGAGSLTWTQPSAEPTPASNIVWTGSQFAAFASGYTWFSSDGETWTRSTNDLSISNLSSYDVTYQNSYFIVYNSSDSRWQYSSDGLTWSDTNLTQSAFTISGQNVATRRRMFYVGGKYCVFATGVQGTTRILTGKSSSTIDGSWSNLGQYNLIYDANLSGGASAVDTELAGSSVHISVTYIDAYPFFYNNVVGFNGSTFSFVSGSLTPSGNYLAFVHTKTDGSGNWLHSILNQDTGVRYIYWKTTSSNGSYTFTPIVRDITYGNGVWLISTADGLYTSSTVNGTFTLNDSTINSRVDYENSKYIAYNGDKRNSVRISSDASSWTNKAISPIVSSGSLTYTRGDNSDLGNFKTVDFWIYGRPQGQQWILEQSTTRYISFYTNSDGSITVYNVNGASTSNLTASAGSLTASAWNHIRISVDSSTASLYVAGTRTSTTNSWLGSVTAGFKISANSQDAIDGFDQGKIDELLISDELISLPSLSSITVPTTVWRNTSDTDLLLHFDSNFADDTAYDIIEQADLTSAFTISATLIGDIKTSAELSSQATMSVVGIRLGELILTAFTNGSLTADGYRIRFGETSVNSQASLTAEATKIQQLDSSLSSSATLTADANRDASLNSDMSAAFAQTATALRTKQLASDLNTTATVDADVNVDRPLASSMSSSITVDAEAVKTAVGDVSAIALFTPTITVFASRAGDVDLYSSASLTVSASRSRDTEIALSSAMQLDVDYTRIKDLDAAVNSSFTVEATPSGQISFIVSLSSEFTQTQTVDLVKAFDADLSSSFSTTIQTFDSLFLVGSSSQSASATLTAVPSRQRDGSISTEAIATQLTVAAKVGEVVCDIFSAATMSIDGNLIAGGESSMSSAATVDAIPSKLLASAISIQTSAFALSSEPFVGVVGNSTVSSSFSSAVEGVKITDTSATIAGEFLLSTSGRLQRGAAILTQSFGTLTATPLRIRTSEVDFEAIATELVAGTKIIRTSATLTAITTLTADGRDLIIDTIVYKIPAEVRTWTIREETRTYTIQGD